MAPVASRTNRCGLFSGPPATDTKSFGKPASRGALTKRAARFRTLAKLPYSRPEHCALPSLPLPFFIGYRYLRSKQRNRFAAFIGLASVLGIALGVAVLIIVLSVMNGFEREVTQHILGMTADVTVFGGGA